MWLSLTTLGRAPTIGKTGSSLHLGSFFLLFPAFLLRFSKQLFNLCCPFSPSLFLNPFHLWRCGSIRHIGYSWSFLECAQCRTIRNYFISYLKRLSLPLQRTNIRHNCFHWGFLFCFLRGLGLWALGQEL